MNMLLIFDYSLSFDFTNLLLAQEQVSPQLSFTS